MRRIAPLIALLLGLSAFLTACTGGGGPLPHPGVTAVAELLELRRDDSRDAGAYAPYVAEESMAEALAAPSDVPTGTPRVPPFRPPYLATESTSTADVAVVWEPDAGFPEWTPVTVFRTELVDGAWRVTDAVETTVSPEPVVPEAD